VGSTVTISGGGFADTTAVSFGGTNASTFSVGSSGTTRTAIVPNGATTGRIPMTTPHGVATSPEDFKLTADP
jgi:hypothetical protein